MDNGEIVNILVVDDLAEKLLVYETILERLGQNVVTARSGREARAAYPRARRRCETARLNNAETHSMSQSRSSGHSGARLPSLTDPEPIAVFTDYERARDLPKLLPLWEWELETPSEAGTCAAEAGAACGTPARSRRTLDLRSCAPRSALACLPGRGRGVLEDARKAIKAIIEAR